MSINYFYQSLVTYGLYATGSVILVLMFWRYRKVAQTGNRGRMISETLAPGLMVIAAILMSSVAISFGLPRINAALNSPPIQAAVQAGDVATKALDSALSFPVVGGTQVAQPIQFSAPAPFQLPPSAGGDVNPLPVPGVNGGIPAFQVEVPTAVPTVASVPAVPTAPQVNGTYTVRSGDNMYKIAARLLGDGNRYVELCRVNVATVGRSCQLQPGMQISLNGVSAVQRPLVFVPDDDYQPLVLRSAADSVPPTNYTRRTTIAPQVEQAAPTVVPLIFMAAMNTPAPTPTQPVVTVPFVGPTQMPLVLRAAQD